jgi:hypothetical protein
VSRKSIELMTDNAIGDLDLRNYLEQGLTPTPGWSASFHKPVLSGIAVIHSRSHIFIGPME